MPGKRCALAERRRVVGYTQEQLAAVLGVERTTVVRWEAGETWWNHRVPSMQSSC